MSSRMITYEELIKTIEKLEVHRTSLINEAKVSEEHYGIIPNIRPLSDIDKELKEVDQLIEDTKQQLLFTPRLIETIKATLRISGQGIYSVIVEGLGEIMKLRWTGTNWLSDIYQYVSGTWSEVESGEDNIPKVINMYIRNSDTMGELVLRKYLILGVESFVVKVEPKSTEIREQESRVLSKNKPPDIWICSRCGYKNGIGYQASVPIPCCKNCALLKSESLKLEAKKIKEDSGKMKRLKDMFDKL